MAQSNNPNFAKLHTWTEKQLIMLVLVELRLQTRMLAEDINYEHDLDQARLEIMNDNDVVSGDAD